jgi:hypothetical protein
LFAAALPPKRLIALAGGHNDGLVFRRAGWIEGLAAFLQEAAR